MKSLNATRSKLAFQQSFYNYFSTRNRITVASRNVILNEPWLKMKLFTLVEIRRYTSVIQSLYSQDFLCTSIKCKEMKRYRTNVIKCFLFNPNTETNVDVSLKIYKIYFLISTI